MPTVILNENPFKGLNEAALCCWITFWISSQMAQLDIGIIDLYKLLPLWRSFPKKFLLLKRRNTTVPRRNLQDNAQGLLSIYCWCFTYTSLNQIGGTFRDIAADGKSSTFCSLVYGKNSHLRTHQSRNADFRALISHEQGKVPGRENAWFGPSYVWPSTSLIWCLGVTGQRPVTNQSG